MVGNGDYSSRIRTYNFKKQLLDFPNGKNDDMVDAVSNILYFLNESNKFGRVDDYSKVELNSPFN
jgi:hypothetical protein